MERSKIIGSSPARPEQLILVGGRPVALPDAVTAPEWALERDNVQNQRIKVTLGLIQMLEGVLDSNYAILHCSPDRLQEIYRRVREVADSLRSHLGPLLEEPSILPRLEGARRSARASFDVLSNTTLRDLESRPERLPADGLQPLRKMLCVTIGKLHSFLQETFGRIMEADPRSQFDRDYYLSKRFPRDVEEAEWLYRGVINLSDYVSAILEDATEAIEPMVQRLRRDELLPVPSAWQGVLDFVGLLRDLTRKLHEILALRGIRFDEMELLDLYARRLPAKFHQMTALYDAGKDIAERIKASTPETLPLREQALTDLLHAHAAVATRVAALGQEILAMILDLNAFLPIWHRSIGERRALLLYGSPIEAPSQGSAPSS